MVASSAHTSAPRVDSHQHFWRYSRAEYGWIDDRMAPLMRDFLPADLEPPLRAAGFDACIAVQACQTAAETEFLLDLAERHPFIAGVVGWVDLRRPDARVQLGRIAQRRKLVGVRHVVQDEPDDRFLLQPEFCRGVGLLADLDLTYDLLIYPKQLPAAIEFVARFPAQRFVLDHLAKPQIRDGEIDAWARDLARLAAHPHVCAKLSGLVTEADWQAWTPDQIDPYLDVAFDCFGADRLMIGSDWPVCTLAAAYSRTMAVVIDYLRSRSIADQDAVLGGTAARFWRLQAGQSGSG